MGKDGSKKVRLFGNPGKRGLVTWIRVVVEKGGRSQILNIFGYIWKVNRVC